MQYIAQISPFASVSVCTFFHFVSMSHTLFDAAINSFFDAQTPLALHIYSFNPWNAQRLAFFVALSETLFAFEFFDFLCYGFSVFCLKTIVKNKTNLLPHVFGLI